MPWQVHKTIAWRSRHEPRKIFGRGDQPSA
jgi:hypothetical protein